MPVGCLLLVRGSLMRACIIVPPEASCLSWSQIDIGRKETWFLGVTVVHGSMHQLDGGLKVFPREWEYNLSKTWTTVVTRLEIGVLDHWIARCSASRSALCSLFPQENILSSNTDDRLSFCRVPVLLGDFHACSPAPRAFNVSRYRTALA